MPSVFTHAAAALAIGTAVGRSDDRPRVWALGAGAAALPDLDVLAFRAGIPYEHVLGHRGLSHSLPFAAMLAAAVVALCFGAERRRGEGRRLWLYFFLATASHGVLDALTNGGLGVAFLAPFSSARYFFPVRPIEVSPIGVSSFFTARGIAVLASELRWVWAPAALFAAAALRLRRRTATTAARRGPSGEGHRIRTPTT